MWREKEESSWGAGWREGEMPARTLKRLTASLLCAAESMSVSEMWMGLEACASILAARLSVAARPPSALPSAPVLPLLASAHSIGERSRG